MFTSGCRPRPKSVACLSSLLANIETFSAVNTVTGKCLLRETNDWVTLQADFVLFKTVAHHFDVLTTVGKGHINCHQLKQNSSTS